MREELDSYLCKKYPKIFRDRYAPMNQTAMCWGFEIGDGWFNIIDITCGNIQSHIDWSRIQRAYALRFNRALKRAINGDIQGLSHYYTIGGKVTDYTTMSAVNALSRKELMRVPQKVSQVVAVQVKEKFGTLRFYVDGGDNYTDGMIRIAEGMSGVTCEACGNPGRRTEGGWVSTLCETHAEERNATLVPKREF